MTYEKDEVWGARSRRTLANTRPETRMPSTRGPFSDEYATGVDPAYPPVETNAFGPEAAVRAREMDYELTTRIQQESPYIREEVVEHKVHDYRLYVGMWIVAGISGVISFLTFDLLHALVTAVAVVFALMSSPGRQYGG